MAYDIYGNRLKPGHCEFHPDVPERYPCYLCYKEQQAREDYERYAQEMMEEEHSRWMEEEMLRQLEEEQTQEVEGE